MKYSRYSPEETAQIGDGLWSAGHTDLGTITLLFRQPVAALQIKDHLTGEWKWAKPLDGSLTVNTCDALSFLTGGYVKVCTFRDDSLHGSHTTLLYYLHLETSLTANTISFQNSRPFTEFQSHPKTKDTSTD